MFCSRIQTGDTEPIEVLALDAAGDPLVDLADVKVKIRRQLSDQYYDWSDDTFKAGASVTTLATLLTQVDKVRSPGEYKLTKTGHVNGFNTSTIANPAAGDVYLVTVFQDGGGSVSNMPVIGEIKVGGFVDEISDILAGDANPFVVKQSYSYNRAADKLIGNVWLERNDALVSVVSAVVVTWYDQTGSALFVFPTAVGPDTQGVFKVEKTVPGLVLGTPYYALVVATVTGFGTVVGAKGTFTLG
jgi:hypothetical protein